MWPDKSQASARDGYLGPADYTASARECAEYERRMVARLNLAID